MKTLDSSHVTIKELAQNIYVDSNTFSITVKRIHKQETQEETKNKDFNGEMDNCKIYSLIPAVITCFTEMGRLNDFVSVLRAIVNDKLSDNIALHLLLDASLGRNTESKRYKQRYKHMVVSNFTSVTWKFLIPDSSGLNAF